MALLVSNWSVEILEVPEKHLETLVHLGLTACQAKVYLIAVQNGTTTVKIISEVTKIARPYVYRVIVGLEKIGLIEKAIDKHSVIKAVPLQDGISYLVQRKKYETKKLALDAQKLLQDFKKYENETIVQDYMHQFVWISENEPYIRKRHEEIDKAKTSIDFITSWKRLPLAVYTFGENVECALQRKVRIRVVMEKPPKTHPLPKLIQKLKEHPNYDLRYIPNSPLAVIGIFDRKRIFLDTSSSAGLAEHPALWSNNQSLVDAMQDYYDILWTTAQEDLQYFIDNEQNEHSLKKLKTVM